MLNFCIPIPIDYLTNTQIWLIKITALSNLDRRFSLMIVKNILIKLHADILSTNCVFINGLMNPHRYNSCPETRGNIDDTGHYLNEVDHNEERIWNVM